MVKKYAPLVLVTLATMWAVNKFDPLKKVVTA